MRLHLFEFEDLSWFPNSIREGGTDYLRYFLKAAGFYKPVVPIIAEALEATRETALLDLCSGGGGPLEQVYDDLRHFMKKELTVKLSDKFPNVNAYEHIRERSGNKIGFRGAPTDATDVPADATGFRTLFSAVHHFDADAVRKVLKNSVENNTGIALFDGGDKNVFTVLGIVLFHPLAFLVCTPFFKPFKLSRIVFTYLLPLIPLTTVWDGVVSILRLYSPQDLLKLAEETEPLAYTWKAGKVRNRLGMHVTYLVGYPKPDLLR